jgi:eukaryotic-like serine/threonine-protein kinase
MVCLAGLKFSGVFKFLTSKPLWVNIVAGLVLLLLLLLLFLGSLALLTQHGKTMKIPVVTGLPYDQAKKTLESQGFAVQIQDSVYYDTTPPLQVVKQFPEADNLVKVNRTVYLTINRAEAPFIQMPNLVSMSFRNADMILRQYGLRLEDTVFKPDFAKNSVLDQLYKGATIKPGTQIQQGSSITLVLGNGIGDRGFIVPDLFGLTYRQAKARIDSLNLTFGSVVPKSDVRDSDNAYIYKQEPAQFNEEGKPNRIRPGMALDVFLQVQKPEQGVDSSHSQPQP